MKKLLFFTFAIFFIFPLSIFSFSRGDIKSYVFENGFHVYFLQDTQAAPVRIELNIKAGFLCQTEKNGGFFEIYANFLGLELDSDCARITKTVAPSDVENTLKELTSYFNKLTVTDNELKSALAQKKLQIEEFAYSPAGFINSAMDCLVFQDSPWRQQSGINPSSFALTSTTQARSILEEIGTNYYTPQNASIYISGNITENSIVALTEKYFAKLPSTKTQNQPSTASFNEKNPNKKFVLSDDELSSDIMQIVMQYTNFSASQADMISFVMDNNYSEFKRLLMKQKNLSIRSPEYINVSSAQTKNSSRLIIQSIIEKAKVNPVIQAGLFVQMATEPGRFSQDDFSRQIKNYESYFSNLCDNSTLLMESLAQWNSKSNANDFFERANNFAALNATELEIKYLETSPYIFVLVNSQIYAKYENDFKKAGWTHLTKKNGAWYTQKKYHAFLKNQNSKQQIKNSDLDIKLSAQRFIQENKNQISSKPLNNGIPVTIKHNPSSKTSAICLTINGGELLFAQNTPGLCSVLTDCLAAMIERQIYERIQNGILKPTTEVSSKTTAEYSLIIITCDSNQTEECIKAATQAIVFSDITPALADGITYNLRTQWRIQTGNPEFQLLCEAIRTMYSKPYTNLFIDTKDKPTQMDFTQIATNYPLFLDCTRFSLVIAGGTQSTDKLFNTLNETFGVLTTHSKTASIDQKVKKISVPKKTKRLQLRHQFFTDISADKAGPRPAVLIPTTDFSDPLLYVFDSPDIATTDCALFNALLYELTDRIQKKVSQEQIVKSAIATEDLPFAQIKITKIKHTQQTDKIYSQAVEELLSELENLVIAKDQNIIDTEKDRLLATMENRWLMNTLSDTTSAKGTAELIQKGLIHKNPSLYLDQYQAISAAQCEDYYIVAKAYLEKIPALRIYSRDSKN